MFEESGHWLGHLILC